MPGYRRAYKTARRIWPLMLAGWRRWDNLADHEKERYKQQAKRYATQAAAYARVAASHAPRPSGGGGGKKKRR
jgi:hypothetical protein